MHQVQVLKTMAISRGLMKTTWLNLFKASYNFHVFIAEAKYLMCICQISKINAFYTESFAKYKLANKS